MLDMTDEERSARKELRALSTDSTGAEILVGLTVEESEFLIAHRRRFVAGDRAREDRKRSIELSRKHEAARFEVLGAENQKKNQSPTSH